MSLAAGMLLFDNFVSHLFPVTVKIVAYIKHNVDFVSTAFDSQRGFGYLDFEKRLGRGKSSRHTGYLYVRHIEYRTHQLGEVRINTYRGHVFQFGMLVVKSIDPLREVSHRHRRVGCRECGEVYTVKDSLVDILIHIFSQVLRKYLFDFGFNYSVIGSNL